MNTKSDNIEKPDSLKSQKEQKEQEDYLHNLVRERAKKRELELNALLQEMLSITKGKPIIIDNSRT